MATFVLLHRSFCTLMYLFNLEDCLSCTVYIGDIGASLIEINEGMSELLDKQVDTENENLKINF